ncbi:MAG: tail fiber protein [Flavipsychrobacter sp.]|nr:tail fiber protein [Flavipsychrobacter sp.]
MDPFIGLISAFGFNFAPYQWAACGGQLVAVSSNTALFSLLGTQYGGDGRTSFGLPNLNSRAAVGAGPNTANFTYTPQGSTGGAENVNIGTANLPPHSHNVSFSINSTSGPAVATQNASGGFPANMDDGSGGVYAYNSSPTTGQFMASLPTITIGNAGTGVGGTVGIRQPYLAINYCIAMYGVFPSRA